MKRLQIAAALALMIVLPVIASGAIDPFASPLKDIKCPVSGKPASEEHHVSYKEGQVYFCCPNCPKGFEANTEKFAAKANKQLVQTGQYEQTACPFSGKPVKVKVGENPEIGFCCNNCKGKYEAASEEEQLNMVFGDKPFEKGFSKKDLSDE